MRFPPAVAAFLAVVVVSFVAVEASAQYRALSKFEIEDGAGTLVAADAAIVGIVSLATVLRTRSNFCLTPGRDEPCDRRDDKGWTWGIVGTSAVVVPLVVWGVGHTGNHRAPLGWTLLAGVAGTGLAAAATWVSPDVATPAIWLTIPGLSATLVYGLTARVPRKLKKNDPRRKVLPFASPRPPLVPSTTRLHVTLVDWSF